MVILNLFSWWFTSGWNTFLTKLKETFASLADFFSMSSLIRTLFQPYRQISANTTNANASIDMRFHAFTDRLVSRCVGFFTRLFLLVVGLFIMIVSGIAGIIVLIIWPLIPLTPIVGIILTIAGLTL